MRYVLGVDGGGTKTELALMSEDSSVLLREKIGCTNHEHLTGSFAELQALLQNAVTALLNKAGAELSQITYAVLGMAGADTRHQQNQIEQAVHNIGINRFLVCNDAFLPIWAGSDCGFGISSINGTGCIVAGIGTDGIQMHIGGMGSLTGDCGGGDYLGQSACAAAYAMLYKKAAYTQMMHLLMREAHADQPTQLFDALSNALRAKKLHMRDLNRVVFDAANQNDTIAIEILRHMGRENARSIGALLDGLALNGEIPIILAGSIWQKGENAAAVEELKHCVQTAHPLCTFAFTLLHKPPIIGALLWAYMLAGYHEDVSLLRKKVEAAF